MMSDLLISCDFECRKLGKKDNPSRVCVSLLSVSPPSTITSPFCMLTTVLISRFNKVGLSFTPVVVLVKFDSC